MDSLSAQEQQKEMNNSLNNSINNDSQRRNKKRKPPDYYKNNYPVEILKRENEELQEQQQQQQQQQQEQQQMKQQQQSEDKNDNKQQQQQQNQHDDVFITKNNEKTKTNDDYEEDDDDDDGTGSFESGVVSSNSITNSNPEENDFDSNINPTNTNNSNNINENNEIISSLKINDSSSSTATTTTTTTTSNTTITNDDTNSTTTSNTAAIVIPTPSPATVTATAAAPTTTNTSSASSAGKSWASLFMSNKTAAPAAASSSSSSTTNDNNNNKKKPLTNSTSATTIQKSQQDTTTNLQSTASSSTSSLAPQQQASSDTLKSLGEMLKQCELKHSAPALQPRGIKNKSNWCYVNATLQALLACPPFYNFIKSCYARAKQLNIDSQIIPCIYTLGKFVNEFKTMVRPSQSQETNKKYNRDLKIGDTLEIDYFYEALGSLRSDFQFKGRQEDAQEFLSFLLNRLHDEMVKCLESQDSTKLSMNGDVSHNEEPPNPNSINGTIAASIENPDEWKEVGRKNKASVTRRTEFKQSPVSDIFCGQFRSSLTYGGAAETVSLEPFFTLPLDIQNDSIRSVTEALEHFVKKEELLDFTNSDTKQNTQAFRRISFEDLPPVLILYLKCFIYDKNGGIQKLLKRLDYAIDLEISKELISPNQRSKIREKKRNYKLFAVEYHYGDKATGGHYITDVYHPGIVGWVRYDDANVKVVSNSNVLKSDDKKQAPYLLYYRRTDLI